MEVMEEGDLMDRVSILLQRDRQYYDQHQTVLQETICPGVVGGTLDFPRSASFAAVKIVEWWEDEYYAAYKKNSGLLHLSELDKEEEQIEKLVVKSSNPESFVKAITTSADKLLEHIHSLCQEALDHADLTVLTAVIGATALIKNSLWVYVRSVTVDMCLPKGDEDGKSLKISYKQYNEMTESLAERLLDLHTRVLCLYIIQDADCLHWESRNPFFESERGSYTIQMWWLYMQGTKRDLWNSVPPGMAKRVLAGMLNETLTILAVRYAQIMPSSARSQLVLVDISNLLFCVSELMPAICENGEAYTGLNITQQNKSVRDLHCKCQQLFSILLWRGIPLNCLYKSMKNGPLALEVFKQTNGNPYPWILFAMPSIFGTNDANRHAKRSLDFQKYTAIALKLKILLNSPQANWPLVLKLLLTREAALSLIIFQHLVKFLPTGDCFKPALSQLFMRRNKDIPKCKRFLCGKECNTVAEWLQNDNDPVGQTNYQVVMALTYIIVMVGRTSDIKLVIASTLEKSSRKEWAQCLDRRQVWNQKRPPWFEAIHYLVYPILDSIVNVLISAMESGSTIYQVMALSLSCLSEMWTCIPKGLCKITSALSDIITAEIRPLGDSVLIQTLYSALYTKILEVAEASSIEETKATLDARDNSTNVNASLSKSAICYILAEAICSIDEDNKHTEAINALIRQAQESQRVFVGSFPPTEEDDVDEESEDITTELTTADLEYDVDVVDFVSEVLLSDILVTSVGKQSMKMMYNYLKSNAQWLLQRMNVSDIELKELQRLPGQNIQERNCTLLETMFHIGHQPFDQLLSGDLRIDYNSWLKTPMSVSVDRVWAQVSKRYEFQENSKISLQDTVMVAFITSQLKPQNKNK